jgi:transposase
MSCLGVRGVLEWSLVHPRNCEESNAMLTVDDELWELIQPLLPVKPRRCRYPGRKPLDDRRVLNGILFVLATGIQWTRLPQQLGYGSGMTCWRRLRDWHQSGVWQRLHLLLLAELHAAGQVDWSRAIADSSHVRAVMGGPRLGRARLTAAGLAPSIMC